MKRIKANNHPLHVLKNAPPKLRKAIISNCDRDLVNCISECVNIELTVCEKRKLSKHKLALRKLVYRQVQLPGKKRPIVKNGGFLLPLPAAILPTLARLIVAK